MQSWSAHAVTKYRSIMLGGGLLCLAPLAAVWPAIDIVITTLVLAVAGGSLAASGS